jgi:hypothetical protein
VDVHTGAFADIVQNVFDFNRHSISAHGDSGGYRARGNLILKGGGWHGGTPARNIHVVDVHGTKNCPTVGEGATAGGILGVLGAIVGAIAGYESKSDFLCGDAGSIFEIAENTFQYNKTTDIKIRGIPKWNATISGNIFARSVDDAVIHGEAQWYCLWLCTCVFCDSTDNFDNVVTTATNQFGNDTYGQYAVCDVDGDSIDDLVLMTGNTWWFSSAGRFPWSFLKTDPRTLKDVQLGDFDGDGRCDVLKGEVGEAGEPGDAPGGGGDAPFSWWISSGAREQFKLFVPSIAPLNEVRFGRFDPNGHNSSRRPPLTHAFWRNAEGFWFVTPISQPSGWTLVQSSSFPLANLRFGSFKIAGVTDVLANEGGRWAISRAARGGWEPLNSNVKSYPVKNSNIFIANTKGGDTVDDVLRFEVDTFSEFQAVIWRRSKDGTEAWGEPEWKSHRLEDFTGEDGNQHAGWVYPGGFVGLFSAAPGASTLTIDRSRVGHFFSRSADGREAGWFSDGVDNQTIDDNQTERLFFY